MPKQEESNKISHLFTSILIHNKYIIDLNLKTLKSYRTFRKKEIDLMTWVFEQTLWLEGYQRHVEKRQNYNLR